LLWGVHRIDKQSFAVAGLTNGCDFLPRRMTTDDLYVYESRYGQHVKAAQKDGGGAVVTVVKDFPGLSVLATAPGYLYYASDTVIFRRPAGLSPASDGGVDAGDELFADTPGGVTDMTADSDAVFWVGTSGKVLSRAHGGGPIVELASGQNAPQRLAVYDAYVFWTTTDHVVRGAPKKPLADAGSGAFEIASQQATPIGIAADSDGVYWANFGDGTIRMARRIK
jgi:hypothetical protein